MLKHWLETIATFAPIDLCFPPDHPRHKAALVARKRPVCFKSNPGPQDQAENCCNECKFNRECLSR